MTPFRVRYIRSVRSVPFSILDTVLNTNVAQSFPHEVDCTLQHHIAVANIVKQVAEKTNCSIRTSGFMVQRS